MHLLVYGSRTFAQTMADLALDCGHDVVGMIDDWNSGPGIVGTLEQARQMFPPGEYGVVLGIGYADLAARWEAWSRVQAAGWVTPALVHPRAYVARTAELGDGCAVMAGALVDRMARLGRAVVVWPGACISHDAAIGDNTFVAPNATVCGFVQVGGHSFIGAGAAIADHCVLPERSFVKMHSSRSGRTT
jgi:sugar O-acyltransferase (sialic acid O-acetyltransferase NeuD family)